MPQILFFPYFGPNRHSDKRVIELRLDFGRDVGTEFPVQTADIHRVLLEIGALDEGEVFPAQALKEDRIHWYSSLLAQTVLLLQRKNGHRLTFFSVSPEPVKQCCIALVEHEDPDVGMAAVKLAVDVFSGRSESLAQAYRQFSGFARERALPFETEAIINAARQRKIPVLQLERAPLAGWVNTGFRVRKNGLLSLGHGVNSHILDGTFCLDKAGDYLKALLRNPDQRAALLKQLGMPVVQRKRDTGTDGGRFLLLAVNGKVTAIAEKQDTGRRVITDVHESVIEQTLAVSSKLGFAPLVVTYQSTDISQPLRETGGVVVDFELGPDLYELFSHCSGGVDLLPSAAGDLVDWLYPDPAGARIPMVAVTGTNGKTTTSRMIRHIFQGNGRKPGLVCTDGIFFDEKQISDVDRSTFSGHARVLTSQKVDAAVLETHHRGIAVHGFAFQDCDVAVCLNVTEEHLAPGEIETVEEMAGIKCALVERASHAAVLFADDAHCMSMLEKVTSTNICLVSLQHGVAELGALASNKTVSCCVLETMDDQEWIILYHDGKRLPVMPVVDIPATFDGSAKVNVSNAMHAIAATFFSGVDLNSSASALRIFSTSQKFTPGRLNVFDELPFRIIMDFAHNPDGMQKLCEFADRQNVAGRKLIAFAGLSKRSDDINRKIAQTVAGHFDYYFCKDYEPGTPPKRKFTGPFMQKVLVEEGVPEHLTTVLTYGRDVIFQILDSCKPGDLLLLMVGHTETQRAPVYIREYLQSRPALRNNG